METPTPLRQALRSLTQRLLGERDPGGYWPGELSSSALSTATAVIALSLVAKQTREGADLIRIERGLAWLKANQNADGGWGDTVRSKSNISTTALVWSAWGAAAGLLPEGDGDGGEEASRARAWLETACGARGNGWERALVDAIRSRYGKDHTFSVPILMACALGGRLGKDGWDWVPSLPFELAALPHQVFGFLRLPVVSYALPALIAIGQVVHHFRPSRNPVVRLIRAGLMGRTMRVLAGLQPVNGGFLEATPLTSFVLMSLAARGEARCCVAERALEFIRGAVRADGSWPIDTHLATWVSTWAVQSLAWQEGVLRYEERSCLRDWILAQQYRQRHPYTHAAPGGWAWTPLPGGVPDADDTSGALVALLELGPMNAEVLRAGTLGIEWLLGIQNRDGGVPTFCRGWGALPFDRSSADITAHALRAWSAWFPHLEGRTRERVGLAMRRAVTYLTRTQASDGTWIPLWFGNQHAVQDENKTYGTARVLMAMKALRSRGFSVSEGLFRSAEEGLLAMQLPCGAWGGSRPDGSQASIEETGLALEALVGGAHVSAVMRGTAWLLGKMKSDAELRPAPIGFYFAKLWYFERLYPLLAAVGALGAVTRFYGSETFDLEETGGGGLG
ncbi:MAG: hypothetical protein RLZZ142_522 [Verrucomicrobiota bacterium]